MVRRLHVRGRENVIRFFTDRAEMFDDLRIEIERVSETGERVLVFLRLTPRGLRAGPFTRPPNGARNVRRWNWGARMRSMDRPATTRRLAAPGEPSFSCAGARR